MRNQNNNSKDNSIKIYHSNSMNCRANYVNSEWSNLPTYIFLKQRCWPLSSIIMQLQDSSWIIGNESLLPGTQQQYGYRKTKHIKWRSTLGASAYRPDAQSTKLSFDKFSKHRSYWSTGPWKNVVRATRLMLKANNAYLCAQSHAYTVNVWRQRLAPAHTDMAALRATSVSWHITSHKFNKTVQWLTVWHTAHSLNHWS